MDNGEEKSPGTLSAKRAISDSNDNVVCKAQSISLSRWVEHKTERNLLVHKALWCRLIEALLRL
jgi:hypothetical protein